MHSANDINAQLLKDQQEALKIIMNIDETGAGEDGDAEDGEIIDDNDNAKMVTISDGEIDEKEEEIDSKMSRHKSKKTNIPSRSNTKSLKYDKPSRRSERHESPKKSIYEKWKEVNSISASESTDSLYDHAIKKDATPSTDSPIPSIQAMSSSSSKTIYRLIDAPTFKSSEFKKKLLDVRFKNDPRHEYAVEKYFVRFNESTGHQDLYAPSSSNRETHSVLNGSTGHQKPPAPSSSSRRSESVPEPSGRQKPPTPSASSRESHSGFDGPSRQERPTPPSSAIRRSRFGAHDDHSNAIPPVVNSPAFNEPFNPLQPKKYAPLLPKPISLLQIPMPSGGFRAHSHDPDTPTFFNYSAPHGYGHSDQFLGLNGNSSNQHFSPFAGSGTSSSDFQSMNQSQVQPGYESFGNSYQRNSFGQEPYTPGFGSTNNYGYGGTYDPFYDQHRYHPYSDNHGFNNSFRGRGGRPKFDQSAPYQPRRGGGRGRGGGKSDNYRGNRRQNGGGRSKFGRNNDNPRNNSSRGGWSAGPSSSGSPKRTKSYSYNRFRESPPSRSRSRSPKK